MASDDTVEEPTPARSPGLLTSLRRLLATSADILHTRVEIFSTELEEEGVRGRELLIYGLVAFFFIGLGLLLATILVVVVFWETHRLAVLSGFAALYLTIGVGAVLVVRHKLMTRPRLFSTTLSELRKDYQRLVSRP